MQYDAIKEIFTKEIRDKLRKNLPNEEINLRLEILEASGPIPNDYSNKERLKYLIKRKYAWDTYLNSAYVLRLFDGKDGNDLKGRLTSENSNNFRSAMAECMASWFFAGKLKFPLFPHPEGRKNSNPLEFSITYDKETICVEVKSPYRIRISGWGDDSDLLKKSMKSANEQFSEGVRNILVIVPEFTRSLFFNRRPLTTAFFGNQGIVIPISKITGEPVGKESIEFCPNGNFIKPIKRDHKPGFTRIGAVICIEELIDDNYDYVEHTALVVHNPYARYPIYQEMWGNIPQFIAKDDKMVWTDRVTPWP